MFGVMLIVLLVVMTVGIIGYYASVGFGTRSVDRAAEGDIGDIAQGRFDQVYQKLNLAPEDRAVVSGILQVAVADGSCRFSIDERQRTAGGVVMGNAASISGTLTCGRQSLFVVLQYAGKGTLTSPYKLYQVSVDGIKNAENQAANARLLNVYTDYRSESAPNDRSDRYSVKSISEANRILVDGTIGSSCRQVEPTKVDVLLLSNAHVDSWRTVSCAAVKKSATAM